ncbi:uncharacterized protein PgNI_03295, partial [Pyricularia grisea]|uniref:Uncharacterized protein n=1 Tax=Pyricularia grisea TaxID=148305 RepID=A0A6P8B9B0_PYRGI
SGGKLGFEWAEASTITHLVSKTTNFCPVKPLARLLRHPSHLFWKEKHANSTPWIFGQGRLKSQNWASVVCPTVSSELLDAADRFDQERLWRN